MSKTADAPAGTQPLHEIRRWQMVRGVVILLMGGIAIVAPFLAGPTTLSLIGPLLIVSGILEAAQTFYTRGELRRRSMYLTGALSVLAGLLLLARPMLLLSALLVLLAITFLFDGIVQGIAAMRTRAAGDRWSGRLVGGLANIVLGILLLCQWPLSGLHAVGILVGLRLFTAGWSLLITPVTSAAAETTISQHPDWRLRLPPHPELARLQATLTTEEEARRWIDTYWCLTFVVVFFAIHIGRMDADWTLVGLLSPAVAALGDVATALLLAFGLILPCRLSWRALTRPVERRAWSWWLGRVDRGCGLGLLTRPVRRWLVMRYVGSLRLYQARFSPRAALSWGLQVGLPLTAVLIALNPIWGFSWYFNSENWATQIWNRWAEHRTDTWRAEMAQAVKERYRDCGIAEAQLFQVTPEGVAGSADFSFVVIGDPGEGDSSQESLLDQYLFLGQRPEVKFLVVSSDVIYPAGAMKDYESKFYLPFKGFRKPIYAIPGNHDWYDALEGFNANFLEADAARAAITARVTVDRRLTTTTDTRIATMIEEAGRLRREYGIHSGKQRAPYFELQAERFALIAVDTGVARSIDKPQRQWLQAALQRARGKFILVILGHPLYAAGRYQGAGDEPFAAIHQLLREHQVDVVMAGDTHDLEYYRESYRVDDVARTMQHFVNGGGGAYLSVGTALDWPRQPPVPDCAFYPRTDAVMAKLDAQTPCWKTPLWWWVKYLGAWPSSAEGMASAFDFNRAPFFQSFLEVRVEGSANVVRLRPYGANGRLRWRDLQTHGAILPAGQSEEDLVEFTVPMPERKAK